MDRVHTTLHILCMHGIHYVCTLCTMRSFHHIWLYLDVEHDVVHSTLHILCMHVIYYVCTLYTMRGVHHIWIYLNVKHDGVHSTPHILCMHFIYDVWFSQYIRCVIFTIYTMCDFHNIGLDIQCSICIHALDLLCVGFTTYESTYVW